jgi:2-oxoglutarate ferredoxin oxidoreductase subunit delta
MDRKRENNPDVGSVRWATTAKAEGQTEKVLVYDRWCKGCGICVRFCPRSVLALSEHGKAAVVAPEKCTQCELCEMLCPDFAITVLRKERVEREPVKAEPTAEPVVLPKTDL